MKRSIIGAALVIAACTLMAGCKATSTSTPTSPTSNSTGAIAIGSLSAGTWATYAADPLPGSVNVAVNTCGNFKWAITSLTLVSATGTFSANCGGGLALAGNASATLSGTTAQWRATGSVTGSVSPCSFDVSGSAALENSGVRVTYAGSVCGTTIQGSELLNKR